MYTTTLLLDLSRLRSYFPILDETSTVQPTSISLEYIGEENFKRINIELLQKLEEYKLTEHHNELLYLILLKNEQIRVRYDAYWENYNHALTSKEVAKFLLTFKETRPTEHFQLVARPTLSSASAIKDTAIAKWMCEVLYDRIERKDFPLGLFGEKLLFDLFGNNPESSKTIEIDRLKLIANKSPKVPTVRLRKLYVELCCYLQPYLIEQTHLTAQEGTLLTDQQANLFFCILDMIGYIDGEKITSEPKDYMHSMFSKHAKLYTS
ncbi:hypothetical protein [Pedobacter sp. Leaf132]|uniref:hypothetical protein n=1 Tax=Pedobacter sp. Leaf132 TaxID=2876557 RepID=UPI001E5E156F|nr:hypothetical protein [Pedobacter sp. Leaf132]